ncbi:hypothetical protein M3Y95_01125200 [Aphelenchoides besseyi]|nr:hypothetical protein M3Y95_01125200 [Aphelenchoides besseyi]
MMFSTTYEILLLLLTILTVVLQIYIIFLTRYKLPKSMENYRFFLYVFTFWDLVFTFTFGILVVPYPLAPVLAADIRGVAGLLSFESAKVAVSALITLGANVIHSQFWCLCYRFVAVLPNKSYQQAFCSVKWKLFVILVSQCVTVSIGVGFYHTINTESETYHVLSDHLWLREDKKFEIRGRAILIEIVAFPWAQKYLYIVGILFVLTEVACGVLVYVTMKILNKYAASDRSFRLQRQLLKLLTLQISCPLIFIFLPVIAVILVIFFETRVLSDLTDQIGLFMLSLIGLINCILCLVFIGPYKQYTYSKFIKPFLLLVCPGKRQNPKIYTLDQRQQAAALSPTVVYNDVPSNALTASHTAL